jgi:hypothetical protein
MSRAERERSREQGNASGQGSGDETERVQQFGILYYGRHLGGVRSGALATVVGYITDYLGWLYMLMTSFFLAFAAWLAMSRYGKIRLGQSDDKPE